MTSAALSQITLVCKVHTLLEIRGKYRLTLCIVNIYATIIGLQRLVQRHQARPGPNNIALRAARRVLNIILDFWIEPNLNVKFKSITNQ
jgi:hypothetical protein